MIYYQSSQPSKDRNLPDLPPTRRPREVVLAAGPRVSQHNFHSDRPPAIFSQQTD